MLESLASKFSNPKYKDNTQTFYWIYLVAFISLFSVVAIMQTSNVNGVSQAMRFAKGIQEIGIEQIL